MYGKRSKRTNATKRTTADQRKQPSVGSLVRMVKQLQPEVKEISYPFNSVSGSSFASVSFGSGAVVAPLATGIAQGPGRNQRVGNKIKVIGIQIRLAISGADAFNNFRLLLVKPKTAAFSTGAATVQNILSGTASSSTQWLGPVDTDRYHVLMDKEKFLRTLPLDGNSSSTTLPIWMVRKFLKVNSIIQWDQENGPDPSDWLLVAISDSNLVPNPGAIAGFVKLYYTDA